MVVMGAAIHFTAFPGFAFAGMMPRSKALETESFFYAESNLVLDRFVFECGAGNETMLLVAKEATRSRPWLAAFHRPFIREIDVIGVSGF